MTAEMNLEAVHPEPWESYLAYPFHIGGQPGVISAELPFWDFLVDEGETVAEELAGFAVETYRGEAAAALHARITRGHAPGLRQLLAHAGRMRQLVGDYDVALADLRELMELNKEQAKLHRDGWAAKGRDFESLAGQVLAAAGSGDMARYHRLSGEMLLVQEEYLHHIREFSTCFDNAVDLRAAVVDLDDHTASRMGRLSDDIDAATSPTTAADPADSTLSVLEVVEKDLIKAGRRLIDEGAYLQWLPAAVAPVPAAGVDVIAGDQVVATSAEVVDALNAAVAELSARVQVTGSTMVGAAVHYEAADEQAAAELLKILLGPASPDTAIESRTAAGYSQSMIEELDRALTGGEGAGARLAENVDRGVGKVTSAANIVTTSAAIADAVDAGIPVGEAVRKHAEPMAQDTVRDMAFAKVNRQLSKRVAGAAVMSLIKPRLVGRLGAAGVAANVAIAGYDGATAVRQARETKRRMQIRERRAGQD